MAQNTQADTPYAQEEALLVETMQRAATAVEHGEVDGLMAMFHDSPETFLFDYYKPRSVDYQTLQASFTAMLGQVEGNITFRYSEIHPFVLGTHAAWSWAIMHVAARMKDGSSMDLTVRVTDIWRQIGGRWRCIHEHASFPVDIQTGQADLQSRP